MDTVTSLENITSAVPSDNISMYVSIAITAIAALFVLFGVIFGLKRGFSRTVVRLLTVALSAVAAYFIAASLGSTIAGLMNGMSLIEVVDKCIELIVSASPETVITIPDNIRNLLSSFDAETTHYVTQLIVALVLVPVVFVTVFWLLKLLTVVIYWIVTAIAGMRKRRTKMTSRLLGALVGAVQGALIAAVLLLPLSGFASITRECRAALTAETVSEDKRAANEEFFTYWIDDVTSNPVLTAIGNMGGNALFGNMTSITVGEEKVSSVNSVKTLVSVYMETDDISGMDPMSPSKESQTALENAVDIIGDDPYTATVAAGLMRGINTATDNGSLVIVAEEPMASFVNDVIDVFEDSTKDNFEGDLDTVLHVYFILGDNGVLSSLDDSEELRRTLVTLHADGKTVINYVVDELYLNPRTAHIVNSLTEMSIKIMCDSMGLSDDATALYESVKVGVNNVLSLNEADYASREDYVADVTSNLDTTLKAHDINLDENTLNTMSNYIADNYSDVSEITDEDINRALLSYYGAYSSGEALPEATPTE